MSFFKCSIEVSQMERMEQIAQFAQADAFHAQALRKITDIWLDWIRQDMSFFNFPF